MGGGSLSQALSLDKLCLGLKPDPTGADNLKTKGNNMNIELINEMEQAGFTREQTMVLGKVIEGDLATKGDIKELDAKVEITKAALKRDIETTKAELKRDIETTKAELKRDIKELDGKIETTKAELKKDMVIIMGGYALFILSALVTLSKSGLMSPMP